MKTFFLAFYISISSEPTIPAPDKHGASAEFILLGASSENEAKIWAHNYTRTSFTKLFPHQKVESIKVVPVFNEVFTHDGNQTVDWSDVEKDNLRYEEHPRDYWSSMGIELTRKAADTAMSSNPETIEIIRKQLGDSSKDMNWDTEKQFYFLGRTKKNAYLIRSLNLMTTSIPLMKGLIAISDHSSNLELGVCPGIKFYEGSEQGAAANP